jgi:23S rRNA (guanosine2251-2'-O)-methyltransferase
MMKQLTGQPLVNFLRQDKRPAIDLVFVLQDVEDPVNVGAAFRIADGCGAKEIVMTGSTPVPPHPTIAGIGRGMHRRIPWRYTKWAADALNEFRGKGYTTYAVEVASGAKPYHTVSYPAKVCLVVGNEHHGVTRRTMEAVDAAIYVPMYGKIESLNVHVALAIAAYQIVHSTTTDHRAQRAPATTDEHPWETNPTNTEANETKA